MTESHEDAATVEAMMTAFFGPHWKIPAMKDFAKTNRPKMAKVLAVARAHDKAAAQAKLTTLGEAYDAAPGVAPTPPPVTLTYTNYRGETAERTIIPLRPWFGATEWHPEPQWLLAAIDIERGVDRDFALKDFGQPVAPIADAEAVETQAAADVLAERMRQIEAEGWTAEHDDMYDRGEMAAAAACYAHFGWVRLSTGQSPTEWPWGDEWWKPTDRRRDLVKAGALILAEIERLDRAAARETPNAD